MSNSSDLTSGSTRSQLLRLGTPMIFGIAAAMSMSLVDAYFIGKIGTEQLAAIGFTFPVILTIQSLSIGLGAGAASVAARAYGEGERDDIRRIATDSLVLGLLIVSVLTVAGLMTIRPIFSLLGADDATMEHIVSYMRVWFLGVPLLVIPQIANSLLRAGGDSLIPSSIMITAAVVNAILDPILILGLWGFPRLELVGAAWASNGVRAVTLVLSLSVVIFRENLVTLNWPGVTVILASWKRIIKVALPAAFGSSINPLGIAIVTALLAAIGASTVAAFGVATRIEAFAAIPMFALSAAIGPIAGQNWSSNNRQRVQKALVQSYLFCIVWSLLIGIGLWLGGEFLASQFSSDKTVVKEVATYLAIVPFSLMGYGIVTIAAGCFNAIDLAKRSLIFYISRTALLYVPLSYIATLLANSTAVYIAIATANFIAGALTCYLSLKWLARHRSEEAPGPKQLLELAFAP